MTGWSVTRTVTARLLDIVLLPPALFFVLLEDVVWAGVLALLALMAGLPQVAALAAALRRLPGRVAVPLFLVPEAVAKLGEVWALALLVSGHVYSAVSVYVGVRVLGAVIAVFIYRACEPALLGIGWFARMLGWVRVARDWSIERFRFILERARHRVPHRAVGPVARFGVLRRRIAARVRWR